MKILGLLTLVAVTPIALAQTTNQTATGGEMNRIRRTPTDPQLSITKVTPTQAFEPGVMVMEGTGLDRVEFVFLGGKEAAILNRTPNQLLFLPREGDPGPWMVEAFTRFERAEYESMLLPCLEAWKEVMLPGYQQGHYEPLQYFATVEIVSGAPGFFAVWTSLGLRTNGVTLDPFGYSFWLGAPVQVLDHGIVPETVDRLQRTYQLPLELRGHTLYFQGAVVQNFKTYQRRSFTNMDAADF